MSDRTLEGPDLSPEELDGQAVTELPERAVMSLINGYHAMPLVPPPGPVIACHEPLYVADVQAHGIMARVYDLLRWVPFFGGAHGHHVHTASPPGHCWPEV